MIFRDMETGNNPTIGCVLPATGQQQQPLIVIVDTPPEQGCVDQKLSDEEHYRKTFPKKTILGLSIFILVAGILQIIFQVPVNFQSTSHPPCQDSSFGYLSQNFDQWNLIYILDCNDCIVARGIRYWTRHMVWNIPNCCWWIGNCLC